MYRLVLVCYTFLISCLQENSDTTDTIAEIIEESVKICVSMLLSCTTCFVLLFCSLLGEQFEKINALPKTFIFLCKLAYYSVVSVICLK